MILDIKTVDVSNIDPLNPNDIIDLCQKLDKPFIEYLYLSTFNSLTFGCTIDKIVRKYLSKLNLVAYREMTFQNSLYEKPIKDIRYRINMERYVDYDIRLLNSGNIEDFLKEEGINLDFNK